MSDNPNWKDRISKILENKKGPGAGKRSFSPKEFLRKNPMWIVGGAGSFLAAFTLWAITVPPAPEPSERVGGITSAERFPSKPAPEPGIRRRIWNSTSFVRQALGRPDDQTQIAAVQDPPAFEMPQHVDFIDNSDTVSGLSERPTLAPMKGGGSAGGSGGGSGSSYSFSGDSSGNQKERRLVASANLGGSAGGGGSAGMSGRSMLSGTRRTGAGLGPGGNRTQTSISQAASPGQTSPEKKSGESKTGTQTGPAGAASQTQEKAPPERDKPGISGAMGSLGDGANAGKCGEGKIVMKVKGQEICGTKADECALKKGILDANGKCLSEEDSNKVLCELSHDVLNDVGKCVDPSEIDQCKKIEADKAQATQADLDACSKVLGRSLGTASANQTGEVPTGTCEGALLKNPDGVEECFSQEEFQARCEAQYTKEQCEEAFAKASSKEEAFDPQACIGGRETGKEQCVDVVMICSEQDMNNHYWDSSSGSCVPLPECSGDIDPGTLKCTPKDGDLADSKNTDPEGESDSSLTPEEKEEVKDKIALCDAETEECVPNDAIEKLSDPDKQAHRDACAMSGGLIMTQEDGNCAEPGTSKDGTPTDLEAFCGQDCRTAHKGKDAAETWDTVWNDKDLWPKVYKDPIGAALNFGDFLTQGLASIFGGGLPNAYGDDPVDEGGEPALVRLFDDNSSYKKGDRVTVLKDGIASQFEFTKDVKAGGAYNDSMSLIHQYKNTEDVLSTLSDQKKRVENDFYCNIFENCDLKKLEATLNYEADADARQKLKYEIEMHMVDGNWVCNPINIFAGDACADTKTKIAKKYGFDKKDDDGLTPNPLKEETRIAGITSETFTKPSEKSKCNWITSLLGCKETEETAIASSKFEAELKKENKKGNSVFNTPKSNDKPAQPKSDTKKWTIDTKVKDTTDWTNLYTKPKCPGAGEESMWNGKRWNCVNVGGGSNNTAQGPSKPAPGNSLNPNQPVTLDQFANQNKPKNNSGRIVGNLEDYYVQGLGKVKGVNANCPAGKQYIPKQGGYDCISKSATGLYEKSGTSYRGVAYCPLGADQKIISKEPLVRLMICKDTPPNNPDHLKKGYTIPKFERKTSEFTQTQPMVAESKTPSNSSGFSQSGGTTSNTNSQPKAKPSYCGKLSGSKNSKQDVPAACK